MSNYQDSQIRFSSGPAAANLYQTFDGVEYRLCFDWSFDYIYWKVGTNRDIEVNLLDFSGLELIDSKLIGIFNLMCQQMITQTQYHNYARVNENRARILLLVAKLKEIKC